MIGALAVVAALRASSPGAARSPAARRRTPSAAISPGASPASSCIQALHQRQRDDRAAAHQGHPAALHLLRRLVAGGHPLRLRRAAQRVAARHDDATCSARPMPDASRHALLAGGGTGGHVFPALAVAEELLARGWRVSFAGSPRRARGAPGGRARACRSIALPARPLLGRGARAQGARRWPPRRARRLAAARAHPPARRRRRPRHRRLRLGAGGPRRAPRPPAGAAARAQRPRRRRQPLAVALGDRGGGRLRRDRRATSVPGDGHRRAGARGLLRRWPAAGARADGEADAPAPGPRRQPGSAPGQPAPAGGGGAACSRACRACTILHQAGPAARRGDARRLCRRRLAWRTDVEVVPFLDDVAGAMATSHLLRLARRRHHRRRDLRRRTRRRSCCRSPSPRPTRWTTPGCSPRPAAPRCCWRAREATPERRWRRGSSSCSPTATGSRAWAGRRAAWRARTPSRRSPIAERPRQAAVDGRPARELQPVHRPVAHPLRGHRRRRHERHRRDPPRVRPRGERLRPRVRREATERLRRAGRHDLRGALRRTIWTASSWWSISSAVAERNPEVAGGARRGIPVVRRAEMLAELMRLKYGIAVAGTHGKTTTTSLVGTVLTEAGLDPTVIVGGRLRLLGTGARLGKSEYLVAEADEFDRSFLRLTPVIAVITNIDRDHLDTYGDLEEIARGLRHLRQPRAVLRPGDRLPRRRQRAADPAAPRRPPRRHLRLLAPGRPLGGRRRGAPLGQPLRRAQPARRPPRPASRCRSPAATTWLNALAAVGVGLAAAARLRARSPAALAAFTGRPPPLRAGRAAGAARRSSTTTRTIRPRWRRPSRRRARPSRAARVHAVFQPHLFSRTLDQAESFGRRAAPRRPRRGDRRLPVARGAASPASPASWWWQAARQSGHRNVALLSPTGARRRQLLAAEVGAGRRRADPGGGRHLPPGAASWWRREAPP